jgi:uracil-DNA glycosylase
MARRVPPSEGDASTGPPASLDALADAERACTRCDLYKTATQAVPGQGRAKARVMLVGEQPGDQEDRAGAPFVGPAGDVLARAMAAAGLDRRQVFVTNAVKHFKWEPRGTRRIHQTPRWSEVRACKPWLDAEIALVAPAVLVCLGATAAKALLGASFRLTQSRGTVVTPPDGRPVVATYHPSAVLRATGDDRERLFGFLVADLRLALQHARRGPR